MPHLDEGILHEMLDGEIPSGDLPPIQAHLAACPECRARLEEARDVAGAADRLIETIELAEREPPRRAVIPPRPPARPWGRDLAWAATVVVAVGAGYLARGSRPADRLMERDAAAPAAEVAPIVATKAVAPAESERAAGAAADVVDEPRRRVTAPADPRGPARAKDLAKTPPDAAAEGKLAGSASTRQDTAAKRPRTIGDTKFALEEIVTTGVPSKSAAPAPVVGGAAARDAAAPLPAAPLSAKSAVGARLQQAPAANELRLDQEGKASTAPKREATPVEITFPEALRRLGGALRLIEGLVPVRLEVLGDEVRVVYPLAAGELALEQWLVNGRVSYRLVAPRDFSADSLERLRARVRE